MSSNIEELARRCDCLKSICKIAEANGEQYFYGCQRDIECEDCDMYTYKNNFDRRRNQKYDGGKNGYDILVAFRAYYQL